MLIFGFVLLASSVCTDFAISKSHPCSLEVFQEQSADLIEDLCLEEYNDSDCRPFLEHFSRSDLPDGFSLTDEDDSVQRPESLDLRFLVEQDKHKGKEYIMPAAYVNWISPFAKLSRNNTKGYLLIWENSIEVMCRIFQFDSNKIDLLGKKLRFRYKIKNLLPRTKYQVKVYSMPPPKNLEESQKKSTFMSINITSGSAITAFTDPASWAPSLSTRVLKEGVLEVRIGQSPPHYNLTQFKVTLIKLSYDERDSAKEIIYETPPNSQDSQGLVTFANLDNGVYIILIRVIDPFDKQDGKCLCWITGANGKQCNDCGSIVSNLIKVIVEVPGKWIPPWSTQVLKEGAIQVKIGHSPPHYNLTQFKVMLVKRSYDVHNAFKEIIYKAPPGSQKPEGLVSFTNLEDDEYKIKIEVIDPFDTQDGKCLCWITGTNGQQCNSCGRVVSDWIKVTVADPGEWTPPWSTRVLKEGAIEVTIGHSPPRFNLTQFNVYLLRRSLYENSAFKTISYTQPPGSQKPEGLVSFTNLDNDEYKVVIQVIDPFRSEVGKCLCWIRRRNGERCNSCGSVVSDWIEVSVDEWDKKTRSHSTELTNSSKSQPSKRFPGVSTVLKAIHRRWHKLPKATHQSRHSI
ncbi:hypothetical protein RRG08_032423 [Elysia crispata]|uniref:ILCR1 Ig-like domain-containing protein n=1 Tax=Elysia crispata TaxID=231223 RepID=A0AAE0XQ41_9GAST|nr:hypothetical protein RRG08_032423 [Elysia crispata]